MAVVGKRQTTAGGAVVSFQRYFGFARRSHFRRLEVNRRLARVSSELILDEALGRPGVTVREVTPVLLVRVLPRPLKGRGEETVGVGGTVTFASGR